MMQAISGCLERISRHTSTPSPSGRRTSSTATFGVVAGMRPYASSAVPASPTTTMSPSASRSSRRPRRTTSWSSSRNTRVVTRPVCLAGPAGAPHRLADPPTPSRRRTTSVRLVPPPPADPQRLRKLLDAVLAVGSDLDLPALLRRLVQTAADLVHARYAALGVLDDTRTRLAQFITAGIDEEGHRTIGNLPEGPGILGLLIVDAQPLRPTDQPQHPDRYGFPPGP